MASRTALSRLGMMPVLLKQPSQLQQVWYEWRVVTAPNLEARMNLGTGRNSKTRQKHVNMYKHCDVYEEVHGAGILVFVDIHTSKQISKQTQMCNQN